MEADKWTFSLITVEMHMYGRELRNLNFPRIWVHLAIKLEMSFGCVNLYPISYVLDNKMDVQRRKEEEVHGENLQWRPGDLERHPEVTPKIFSLLPIRPPGVQPPWTATSISSRRNSLIATSEVPGRDAASDQKKVMEDYDNLHGVRPLLGMIRNCCLSGLPPILSSTLKWMSGL